MILHTLKLWCFFKYDIKQILFIWVVKMIYFQCQWYHLSKKRKSSNLLISWINSTSLAYEETVPRAQDFSWVCVFPETKTNKKQKKIRKRRASKTAGDNGNRLAIPCQRVQRQYTKK